MANLYPTGNRGEPARREPSMWHEFQSQVIPAMGRRRDEEQRRMEHNEMRHRDMELGRFPYESRPGDKNLQQGHLGQIGQQMARGPSGDPNAPNSMLEAQDKRHAKDKAYELAKQQLEFKNNKQDDDIGFKYNKQAGDLELKNRIANLKMPEEAKLRLAQQLGIATEEVKQTNRLELGDQRGTQQQANIASTGANQQANIRATGANQAANILSTGAQARETEGVRETNRETLAGVAGQIKADNATNGVSPYQQNIALNTKAKTLFDQNPQWQKYIIRDEKGGFNIVPPGTAGMDEMTHKMITDAIYGSQAKDINLPKDTGVIPQQPTVTPTPTVAAPVSKYKVTVR